MLETRWRGQSSRRPGRHWRKGWRSIVLWQGSTRSRDLVIPPSPFVGTAHCSQKLKVVGNGLLYVCYSALSWWGFVGEYSRLMIIVCSRSLSKGGYSINVKCKCLPLSTSRYAYMTSSLMLLNTLTYSPLNKQIWQKSGYWCNKKVCETDVTEHIGVQTDCKRDVS